MVPLGLRLDSNYPNVFRTESIEKERSRDNFTHQLTLDIYDILLIEHGIFTVGYLLFNNFRNIYIDMCIYVYIRVYV